MAGATEQTRSGRRADGKRKVAVGLAVLGIGLAGVAGVRALRSRAAPCTGDEMCAFWGSRELVREAAAARLWDVSVIARPLQAALRRGECTTAAELARALGDVVIDERREEGVRMARAKEAAVRGTLGYCGARTGEASFDASAAILRFSRGSCEGTCPVYTMTVRGDGSLLFESSFPAAARREGRIDVERARALLVALDRIRVIRLPKVILTTEVDLPNATIEIEVDGVKHWVIDQGACFETISVDAGLCWMEGRIEAIAEERGWLEDAQGRPAPTNPQK